MRLDLHLSPMQLRFLYLTYLLFLVGIPSHGLTKRWDGLPTPSYELEGTPYPWEEVYRFFDADRVTFAPFVWEPVGPGLEFAQTDIRRREDDLLLDRVSVVRIDPVRNRFQAISGYKPETEAINRGRVDQPVLTYEQHTIEIWQRVTGASVLINAHQFQGNPHYGKPCSMMICDGDVQGPRSHRLVRGMWVAEPRRGGLPRADLWDERFDPCEDGGFPAHVDYEQGVAHWPILLDRQGAVRVNASDKQASRCAIAKARDGMILFINAQGGFFTLHNFGLFLRDSDLDIETAMAMDGGCLAQLGVHTPAMEYYAYGRFETNGEMDQSVKYPDKKCDPILILAVFPR